MRGHQTPSRDVTRLMIMQAQRGVPNAVIQEREGVTARTVRETFRRARVRGERIPYRVLGGAALPPRRHHELVELDEHVLRVLVAESQNRKRTVASLISAVLDTIATEQLISAVLDDGDGR